MDLVRVSVVLCCCRWLLLLAVAVAVGLCSPRTTSLDTTVASLFFLGYVFLGYSFFFFFFLVVRLCDVLWYTCILFFSSACVVSCKGGWVFDFHS